MKYFFIFLLFYSDHLLARESYHATNDKSITIGIGPVLTNVLKF